jgi:hypothetical protein
MLLNPIEATYENTEFDRPCSSLFRLARSVDVADGRVTAAFHLSDRYCIPLPILNQPKNP